jgi:hypothetical protein
MGGMTKFIHSLLDPQAAPIIWRLAKPDRRRIVHYPVTTGILLATMTSAAGIAYVASLPEVLRTARFMGGSYQFTWNIFDYLAGASLAVLLITPPVIAALTAILVSRDSHSEAWVLIRVTNLTRRPVFQGYAMAALYRLRLLLAISFGTLPLIAFGAAGLGMRWKASAPPAYDIGIDRIEAVLYCIVPMVFWGLNCFAVSAGTLLGLHFREVALAGALAVAATVSIAIAMILLLIALPTLSLMIVSDAFPIAIIIEEILIYVVVLWLGILPYVLFMELLNSDGPLPERNLT